MPADQPAISLPTDRRCIYLPFECTGRVRRAFAARGWFAVSCDLKPTELECGPFEHHHQGDARSLLAAGWDAMIAFPECRFVARSGLHWNSRVPGRSDQTDAAVEMAATFIDYDGIPSVAVENPIGTLSSRIREPDQIIQPHQFGDDASKATCLWLKGLVRLRATKNVAPRIVEWPPASGHWRARWANQTDSGNNKLAPSEDRAAIRAETYPGIAGAMAEQWGEDHGRFLQPFQRTLFAGVH